jgi:hypothetical protein
MFRVGIRKPTLSRREGKHLMPKKYLLRKNHQSDESCYEVSENLIFPINQHSDITYLEENYCGKGLKFFSVCAQVHWRQ